MTLNVEQLVADLPDETEFEESPQRALQELVSKLSHKPVPVGALSRLWVLGTLQAKIGAAYLVHWIRSSYVDADEKQRQRWTLRVVEKLNNGKIEQVVKTLRQLHTTSQEMARLLSNDADYFERNKERMRYPCFRSQGLFVGSGVVEAGCRTVIGERLKRSGMFWSVRGANAIIALRCCRLSGKFEDYWENRSCAA